MIVGICGKAGTGKTTAARALVEQLGFIRRPLAYALKLDVADIARDRYGLDVPVSERGAVAWVDANKVLLRGVLQTVGTDLVRGLVDNDYWVNRLLEDYDGDQWVVDDVRFVNEAEAIKREGGCVIKLWAPDWLRQARLNLAHAEFDVMNTHPSEREVDDIKADYTLDACGDASTLGWMSVEIVDSLQRSGVHTGF